NAAAGGGGVAPAPAASAAAVALFLAGLDDIGGEQGSRSLVPRETGSGVDDELSEDRDGHGGRQKANFGGACGHVASVATVFGKVVSTGSGFVRSCQQMSGGGGSGAGLWIDEDGRWVQAGR